MEEEKSDIELFDRFLKDELSAEEREAFQQSLKADPELQMHFREYTDIVGGVQINAVRNLKEQLKQIDKSASERKHKRRSLLGYISGIAASILLFAVIGYFLLNRNHTDNAALFKEYYSPYPNVIEPVNRAGNSETNVVWIHYEKGEYKQALEGFSKMISKDPSSVPAHFYSGVCLLSLSEPETAIGEFNRVLSKPPNQFTAPAKWYEALAFIKDNRRKKAREILSGIQAENNDYSDRARTLLNKL